MMPVAALAGVAAPQVDADLMAWARKCARPPDSKFLIVHSKGVLDLKASGIWSALTGIRFFHAPSDGYLINVKTPTERLVEYGTFTKTAFGMTGDGATAYLDTIKTPATIGMTTTSLTVAVYSQTDNPGIYAACGASGGVNTGMIRLRGGASLGVWPSSTYQVTVPVATGVGLSGVVVTGAGTGFAIKDGVDIPIITTTPSLATGTFRYFRAGAGRGWEVATLAFGFEGSKLTDVQADALNVFCRTSLRDLDLLIEPPEPEPVSIANAFTRTVRNGVPGAWQGAINRILPVPLGDWQENATQYTRTSSTIVFVGNAYTTVAGDLGKTLLAYPDATNRTVTLMSAATAGLNAIQVVRKRDRGAGLVTVNGFVLTYEFDFAVFISDGSAWVQHQEYVPSIGIETGTAITWTANAYTTVEADLVRHLQATAGAIAKTVTLVAASTAGAGKSQLVRKIDSGVGVVTVNGVALANQFDYALFTSSGTAWVQDTFSIQDSAWISNNYDTTTLDNGRNIHARTGATNRTVTLMSAATAGSGAICVVRKMDEGVGTVTVNGVVLSYLLEYASFESNGAAWVQDQTNYPLEVGTHVFPVTEMANRPWGNSARSRQTLVTLNEFMWQSRGLGETLGTITAWAKKGNDTMVQIKLTNGFFGRTEFDTYELAMGELFTKAAYSLGYLAKDDTTLTTFDGVYRAGGWGWLNIAEQFGYDISGWAAHVSSTVTNAVDNGAGLVRVTTSAAHGITTGDTVQVSGVVGVSAANTTAVATVINTTTFDLVGTTFSGTYASAGTVKNNTVLTTDVSVNTGAVGHWSYFYDNRDTIFLDNSVVGQFKAKRNVILLGRGRLADVRALGIQPVGGIDLDFEAADGRGPARMERTVRGMARLCHAKSYTLRLLPHHIHTGAGYHGGWRLSNANMLLNPIAGADGIDESVDQMSILTNPYAANVTEMLHHLQLQYDFLKGESGTLPVPYSRLLVELRVGGTGQEISADLVDGLVAQRATQPYAGTYITPMYARFGGRLGRIPNQRLAQFLGVPTS